MASEWYRQNAGGEQGPYSFEDLARQIRGGKLADHDLVRRSEQTQWQRVDKVVGLLRAARAGSPAKAHAASAASALPSPDVPAAKQQPRQPTRLQRRLTRREITRVGIPVGIVCVLCAVGISWWLLRPQPLPRVASARMEISIPNRLAQLRPPLPANPTLGDIPVGVPVPVPGIEKIAWLSAPTMSHDMLTLVFVSVGPPQTDDDLFLAERASISEPFSKPKQIKACASPLKEGYPGLSWDGLELMFSELGIPSRLMISRRPNRQSTFGAPRPVEIAGEQFTDLHVDGVQFLGRDSIRFATSDTKFTQRTQWLAERDGSENRFRITGKLPLANPWLRYFVTANGHRAYYAADAGIFLTASDMTTGEFVTPEKLLGIATVGPIQAKFDSPLWVAPNEDVIVYCSPGVATPDSPDHRLWMIRLGRENSPPQ
jgi:hypothetical protein